MNRCVNFFDNLSENQLDIAVEEAIKSKYHTTNIVTENLKYKRKYSWKGEEIKNTIGGFLCYKYSADSNIRMKTQKNLSSVNKTKEIINISWEEYWSQIKVNYHENLIVKNDNNDFYKNNRK